MSNATTQLATPLAEECDADPDAIAISLVNINGHTLAEHHPRVGERRWSLGTGDADFMVGGGADLSIAAGDGNEVVISGDGDDYLGGDAGDDCLHAGAGNDELCGGSGNDWLSGGAGRDTLSGEAGDDCLLGGAGDDHLEGGAGDDRVWGGAGNDTIYFGRGGGHDRVFNHDLPGDDRIQFREGIAPDQIWFSRVGNDLEVRLIETGESITVDSWFNARACQIDRFQLSPDGCLPCGRYIGKTGVNVLVAEMAAFDPPVVGALTLGSERQVILAPALAAYWT